MFVPKLVTTLQTYTRKQFVADLTAGVVVGELGEENLFSDIDEALAASQLHVDSD